MQTFEFISRILINFTLNHSIEGAIISFFLTFLVISGKFFYPHHRKVSGLLITTGVILLFAKYKLVIMDPLTDLSPLLTMVLFTISMMSITAYFLIAIFPFGGNPNNYLEKEFKESEIEFLFLKNNLKRLVKILKKKKYSEMSYSKMLKNKEEILILWQEILSNFFTLDHIKIKYRAFHKIRFFKNSKTHSHAFVLTYSSFITQCYFALKIHKIINKNSYLIQILDEENKTYSKIINSAVKHMSTIRINAGQIYLLIIKKYLPKNTKLTKSLNLKINYIQKSIIDRTKILISQPLKELEKYSFPIWFPLQKGVAKCLPHIDISMRKKIITKKIIKSFENKLEPGDIIIERTEWRATNLGIPGYWTHTIFYIGTLKELDNYFKHITKNNQTFSQHLKKIKKITYKELQDSEKKYKIIESNKYGVQIKNLNALTKADSIAILRPNISKKEKLEAVLTAIKQIGKPYDFNFDFINDNGLVCSEIAYKAYQKSNNLNLELQEVNGRLLFATNSFVKKIAEDKKQELELILFLDGNEKTRKVTEKGLKEFKKTWKRTGLHKIHDWIR